MFEFLITFSPDSSASLAWKMMLHLLKQSSIGPVNFEAFEMLEELRHSTGTSAKLLQMSPKKTLMKKYSHIVFRQASFVLNFHAQTTRTACIEFTFG